jgi:HEAT repeat protein
VERFEIEALAMDVGDLVGDPHHVVAAAAAVALLNSHPQAPQIAGDLLESDMPRARAIAVEGIARKVGRLARDDLIVLAEDPYPEVRTALVAALATLGGSDDHALLATFAREDADQGVRSRAVRALRPRARELGLDLLRGALADPFLGVRLGAVELLAARDDDDARALLSEAAAGADLRLAFAAAAALARAGGEAPADLFERGLADPDWGIRAAALNSLARATPREEALRLAGGAIVDPRVEVRLAAARVLLSLGQRDRARDEFAAALAAEHPPPIRLSAVTALLRLEDERGVAALDALGRAPDAAVRESAARAHLQAGRPTDSLILALADESAGVRIVAAEILLSLLR